MDNEFTVYYDDQPDEIIEKIEIALGEFHLEIEAFDLSDGQISYRINRV